MSITTRQLLPVRFVPLMEGGPMKGLLAVGLISAAILAFEVLLMRLYAIVGWHHLPT